ncbi:hypothetical protein GCM10023166_00440 [Paeniglutamicibacter cryotolerans]
MDSPVTDPAFAFTKDFPRLTWLFTGPTKVSTVADIAPLPRLSSLLFSTNKALSLKKPAGSKQLADLQMNVGGAKADFASIATLPKLSSLNIFGTTGLAPPAALAKSTSLKSVRMSLLIEKKFAKGQPYKAPAYWQRCTACRTSLPASAGRPQSEPPARSRPTVRATRRP